MGMRPRLTVHIETLVLQGLQPGQAQGIARSLERELARLLVQGDRPFTPDQGSDIPCLDAGSISLPQDAGPQTTGTRLARAVYGGLPR
jgi:hypothetical protein